MSENAEFSDDERCGAENRNGEPCRLPAGWGCEGDGAGRCKFHGGASTGPHDPSKLEGHDNSVGNDGGAPEGNTNAAKYGAWSDWKTEYNRLEGEEREHVEAQIERCIDRATADLPAAEIEEKAREYVIRRRLWGNGIKQVLDEGMIREGDGGETRSNPAFYAANRHTKRREELREELGLFHSPEWIKEGGADPACENGEGGESER